ncbi:cytochrome P450 [Nocardia tenerifensis]|uniref:Cytochrome P450 n=1 Tax=Nocardia tenerifensis TaxID=228006 RepID=A0A318KAJ3_9NOCA|nr:cytochrome P450 [Nocardia tenerifensis]PXX71136.1 cytochrome P450 [Nocardia tenerifensis]
MADIETQVAIETVGEDFFDDPQVYYRRWRERGPVLKVKFPRGAAQWVVIGYAEGRALLADPRLTKDFATIIEIFQKNHPQAQDDSAAFALGGHMLNTDPPAHTRLRKMVNKAFTTRRVAALRPRIEEITAGLLDRMAEHDEVDLLEAFAIPLPVTVICELLGVPFADREDFQRWTKVMVGIPGDLAERARCSAEMSEYLTALVRAKAAEPGDDLLSGLTHAREDGDRLTEYELISMAFLLLIAGHETTVNLIANGTHALLHNDSQLRALRADPSGVPAAVEEFLRFGSPVDWATLRVTAEPVRVGDVEIPADEFVYVALAAANRDPARYHDPDRLDLAGDPAGHLAFGHGIHFCVGAPLARLEGEIAFTGLLRRFPELRMAPRTEPLKWQPSLLIRGLVELPVRLRG